MASPRTGAPPDRAVATDWPPPPSRWQVLEGRIAGVALRLVVAVLAVGVVVTAGAVTTGRSPFDTSARPECPELTALAAGVADATGTTLLLRTVNALPSGFRSPDPASAPSPLDLRRLADDLDRSLAGQESSAVVDDAGRLVGQLDDVDHDPVAWARRSDDRIELLSRLYQSCPR